MDHTTTYCGECRIETDDRIITERFLEATRASARRWEQGHPDGCMGLHRFSPACSCGWTGRDKINLTGAIELARHHKQHAAKADDRG